MNQKKILIADKGMIYTNGEIFGKKLYYVTEEAEKSYYQITEAEYEKILREQEEQNEANNIA